VTPKSQTKNLLKSHEMVDSQIEPNAGWRDLPIGAVIPRGGTAEQFATGDWRTIRPVWSSEKCIHCHRCWQTTNPSNCSLQAQTETGMRYRTISAKIHIPSIGFLR
jgi:Pyruvate/2-oxoacid:ferredoxin oxidoreductase delta subunit